MGSILTREKIIERDDIKRRRVHVPEWGGDVIVKELTGEERSRLDEIIFKPNEKGEMALQPGFKIPMVQFCLVDENDTPLFPGQDGLKQLSKKSIVVINRLFVVCSEVNRAEDEIEALEEERGNLNGGQT
jgi:hypothetical protein